MTLVLTPITLREANAFVAVHHRHHGPARGCIMCVAASDWTGVHAVAIVGRPVARMLDDGWTAEVVRLASDGARNACSMLYAASWRATRALGYRRLVTYTLPSEGGGQPQSSRIPLHRRGGRRNLVACIASARRHASDADQAQVGDE